MRSSAFLIVALFTQGCTDATTPAPGPFFVTVSAGMYHTCALTPNGKAFCWGRNLYGALGDGTSTTRATPVPVAIDVAFTTIAAGKDYTCGLRANGGAYCWGANFAGQLGDGSTAHRYTPVPVYGGLTLRHISAGEAHTCGITTGGEAFCWGAPLSPRADGSMPPIRTVPTRLSLSRMMDVSVGYEIACGIARTHALYCWGLFPPGVTFADSSGPLVSPTPLLVTGSTSLVQVSAAFKHACGVDDVGHVLCWGRNEAGEIGDSSLTYATAPKIVSGAEHYRLVSAHSVSHTCGVTIEGTGYCWGNNGVGQLGAGIPDKNSTVPIPVAATMRWSVISTGAYHTCGVTVDEKTLCWGFGGFGQLGNGEFGNTREPGVISNP